MHGKTIDLTGQRFGRLLVTSLGDRRPNGRISWRCVCDCGESKDIAPADLRHGGTQSCGCLRAEVTRARCSGVQKIDATKRHPLYARWVSIKQRCTNRANPFFKNYGGRGISICPEWLASFQAFAADMGNPPSILHTVERINNDGDYSPDNCRWVLRAAQLRNQRRTILIEVGGVTLAAKDWAEKLGISYPSLTRTFRNEGLVAAAEMVRQALK